MKEKGILYVIHCTSSRNWLPQGFPAAHSLSQHGVGQGEAPRDKNQHTPACSSHRAWEATGAAKVLTVLEHLSKVGTPELKSCKHHSQLQPSQHLSCLWNTAPGKPTRLRNYKYATGFCSDSRMVQTRLHVMTCWLAIIPCTHICLMTNNLPAIVFSNSLPGSLEADRLQKSTYKYMHHAIF